MATQTSTTLAETLTGGAGNDLFVIPSADFSVGDQYIGGGGNDEIRFASTNPDGETLFLDAADSVGLIVIGTGTGATAVTTGTAPHDVIASEMTTAVMLVGNAGDNILAGGSANDTIQGGAGNDVLAGGEGNDRLDGGAGADTMDGEDGADTYVVSNLADFTAADSISDSGDDGAVDTLELRFASGIFQFGANIAGVEAISLVGATATSGIGVAVAASVTQGLIITGNGAANTITGGSGNDTITGGSGADSMAGGAGDDLFVVSSAAEAVGDKFNGGAGVDTVMFTPAGAGATLVLAAGSTGIEQYEIGGILADNLNAAAIATGVVLIGNNANNVLTGGAGADTLIGGGGNDTLAGGAGVDAASYSSETAAVNADLMAGSATGSTIGTDSITGIEGLIGSAYDDTLNGNIFANRIDGGAGNDTITGGAGVDTLLGGPGDDVFIVAAGRHGSTDWVDGGSGNDSLYFTSMVRGDTLTIGAHVTGVETFYLDDLQLDSPGTTTLNVNAIAASSGVNVVGNDGANSMVGSIYGDTLIGGGGNDRLDGGRGDDSLDGGQGHDTLVGGAGNDFLRDDQSGNDLLEGGTGNDVLVAQESLHDTLVGGSGDDGYALSLNDALIVELPNGGYDTVVVGGADDINVFYNTATIAGANFESVVTANNFVGLTLDASAVTTGISVRGGSGLSPTDGIGDDSLIGGSGNDTLWGANGGDDTFVGGLGDDSIIGGGILGGSSLVDYSGASGAINATFANGNGTVTGAAGNDTLHLITAITGSSSNDTLDGGTGFETLNGGGGNDVFVFDHTPGISPVAIGDFTTGHDHFQLSDATFPGVLAALDIVTTHALNNWAFYSAADITTGGTAGQLILYNSSTGALYYDANHDGDGTDAVQFATLMGHPTVAATDFHIVA